MKDKSPNIETGKRKCGRNRLPGEKTLKMYYRSPLKNKVRTKIEYIF
jgi:hypothetical protein